MTGIPAWASRDVNRGDCGRITPADQRAPNQMVGAHVVVDSIGAVHLAALDEIQQVDVELVGIGGGEAMTAAGIRFEFGLLQQLHASAPTP